MRLYLVLVTILCFLFYAYAIPVVQSAYKFPVIQYREPILAFTSANLLFVGDIMLGRRVETDMEKKGVDYPFASTTELMSRQDLTIGNFEGSIPEKHVQTPELTFQFAVKDTYLNTIKNAGFDILSLANNHALDYGIGGLTNTLATCVRSSLVCFGNPTEVSISSSYIARVNDVNVGFIFIHTLFDEPSDEELEQQLTYLFEYSEVQVAYIHWGTEYLLTHTANQTAFAKKLIDAGVDVVIGHHPHVVEDIELYKQKPIFYSLGNYVFDQYFSSDVQEGLGIQMNIQKNDITYSLIPFTSVNSRSQPHIEDSVEQKILFARILSSVAADSEVDAELGIIKVPR